MMITDDQLSRIQDGSAPPEIVIEKGEFGGYLWLVCQPDAAWGVWDQGYHTYAEQKKALIDAQIALRKIYIKLGIIESYEALF